MLLSSKLLPDLETTIFFTKKNLIYLNGNAVSNLKLYIFVGDFTQLVVSNWLIIYRQYLLSYYSLKFIKLKALHRFKLGARVTDTNKSFRTRSTTLPSSFLKYVNFSNSIPSIFEADLFSMSSFKVREGGINKKNIITNKLTHCVNIFKNYN
jgi:hypothetical protein